MMAKLLSPLVTRPTFKRRPSSNSFAWAMVLPFNFFPSFTLVEQREFVLTFRQKQAEAERLQRFVYNLYCWDGTMAAQDVSPGMIL